MPIQRASGTPLLKDTLSELMQWYLFNVFLLRSALWAYLDGGYNKA